MICSHMRRAKNSADRYGLYEMAISDVFLTSSRLIGRSSNSVRSGCMLLSGNTSSLMQTTVLQSHYSDGYFGKTALIPDIGHLKEHERHAMSPTKYAKRFLRSGLIRCTSVMLSMKCGKATSMMY